ncbi:MAG TPA: amidohydrolase family protein [Candidatus Acidoferrales bacterium]|nr:amidohydrolase family protein [Candidatus Acidoferrales bacterium]
MPKPIRFFAVLALLLGPAVAKAQERPIVIRAGTVYDGAGKTYHNAIIVVQGSKIVRIGGAVPAGALVYNLAGLTVTPGWIDTHAHIMFHFVNGKYGGRGEPAESTMLHAVDNAVVTLDAGFTTIQSPGSPEDKYLRDAIARGILPGPRILTSLAPLFDNSGPPDKLRQLVDERKAQGADFIKIFASKSIREGGEQTMTDAQIQAVCDQARKDGLRVIVHAHSAASAKAATLAGCTSIEHGAYLTDDVFNLMAQRGTYYDPNIGLVLQNYLENKDRYFGVGNYNAEGFAFMQKGIQITLDTFKKALRHKGLKIVYGTDATAGADGRNYEEFITRVQDGGQNPMDALVSATSLSARSLNLQNEIGTLAPGMQADIAGFDGDPLKDATAARKCIFVMKGGEVFENLPRGSKSGKRLTLAAKGLIE